MPRKSTTSKYDMNSSSSAAAPASLPRSKVAKEKKPRRERKLKTPKKASNLVMHNLYGSMSSFKIHSPADFSSSSAVSTPSLSMSSPILESSPISAYTHSLSVNPLHDFSPLAKRSATAMAAVLESASSARRQLDDPFEEDLTFTADSTVTTVNSKSKNSAYGHTATFKDELSFANTLLTSSSTSSSVCAYTPRKKPSVSLVVKNGRATTIKESNDESDSEAEEEPVRHVKDDALNAFQMAIAQASAMTPLKSFHTQRSASYDEYLSLTYPRVQRYTAPSNIFPQTPTRGGYDLHHGIAFTPKRAAISPLLFDTPSRINAEALEELTYMNYETIF